MNLSGKRDKSFQRKEDIPRSRLEIICEAVAAVVMISVFLYVIATWTSLPDKVPTHFNFAGEPDQWGGKASLLLLMGVTAVLYAGLSLLTRFPHIFNYPCTITDQNRRRQYLLARQMLTALKTELVLVFSFINWQTIAVARGAATDKTGWFTPVLLIVVFGTIGIYFRQACRYR